MWGVRDRALSHPRLPALWAGCRGPLPTGCGCGGMGAKNGNAAFQRMMEDLLGPVPHCADPLVDDIIIGSGTEDMTEDELIEPHEKGLRRVLSELYKHNMVCKPTKASLFVREVQFAGHVVGHGQRRYMPGKLASLHHWEKPQTISELRSFMAFCNYYSGYVRMYEALSGTLHTFCTWANSMAGRGARRSLLGPLSPKMRSAA